MAFLQGRQAWTVFGWFATGYFLSYALRSVNAVIAPALIADFGLSNAQLGALSAAYFLSFSMMQLPLGVCLDRFGSRRTHAALLLIAALGAGVFAMATSTAGLWLGRALIGLGVCGALMSALKGYRFWYPPQRQSQLALWMLVVGTGGALLVTVPVEMALPWLGWRGVFALAGALLLITSAGICFGVPTDEERAHQPVSGQPVWAGFGEVFRDAYFWRWGVASVAMQSTFVALQSLWAGPWFTQVLGMSPGAAAAALFAFNAVLLAGFVGLSWLNPVFERRGWSLLRLVTVGGAVVIVLQAVIAVVHAPWAWMLWLPMGVASTCFTLIQTHVAMTFPAALTGRAFTSFNLLVFSGIFLCQWLFGVAVDAFKALLGEPVAAFQATLLVWVGVQALAMGVLLRWRVGPRGG